MLAGSFFPQGFDTPGARILPIFFLFHSYILISLCVSIFFPFFFLPFLLFLTPDLRFEEEC